jgi:hypothetical protein
VLVTGESMLSLEHCRTCKGPGTLGETTGYVIFCPDCLGSGLLWRQRLYVRVDAEATWV